MNRILWYCTEDGTIYPDETTAREGYKEWLIENASEYNYDEDIFKTCYRPITFRAYNQLFRAYNQLFGDNEG